MKTQSAKAKGRELENFVVQKLRQRGLDSRATRNPGSGSGKQKGDIWNSLGLCIECKNTKKAPGKEEFEQVRREAMGYQTEVIIWHPPKMPMEESKVILNINDFLDLIEKSREKPNTETPDKQFKWDLIQLRNSIKRVEKYIE